MQEEGQEREDGSAGAGQPLHCSSGRRTCRGRDSVPSALPVKTEGNGVDLEMQKKNTELQRLEAIYPKMSMSQKLNIFFCFCCC